MFQTSNLTVVQALSAPLSQRLITYLHVMDDPQLMDFDMQVISSQQSWLRPGARPGRNWERCYGHLGAFGGRPR